MSDGRLRWSLHGLIAAVQAGDSLYVTALPMIIKERCVNSSNATSWAADGWPSSVSRAYTSCRVLSQLAPIVPCLLLARLGDGGRRKVPLAVPLLGLVLARLLLLLMLLLDWRLEVLYLEVGLAGAGGGVSAVSAGALTLLSLSCAQPERSLLLMRAEVTGGVAGMVGSVASGYLYRVSAGGLKPGVATAALCLLINTTCTLYVVLVFEVDHFAGGQHQKRRDSQAASCHAANMALLWLAVVLYGAADTASKNILVLFEMMGPLHWDITQVGYGNASGCLVIISGFLSAVVLSRWVSDLTLITVGMLANATSVFLMAFVTRTYMFYVARCVTMFSPMPVPIARSLLCQQVHGSSYGIVLTSMQLSLKFSSVMYAQVYTEILDRTLTWFPGLVYIVSSLLTAVAVVPIRIIARRPGTRRRRASEDEDKLAILSADAGPAHGKFTDPKADELMACGKCF